MKYDINLITIYKISIINKYDTIRAIHDSDMYNFKIYSKINRYKWYFDEFGYAFWLVLILFKTFIKDKLDAYFEFISHTILVSINWTHNSKYIY